MNDLVLQPSPNLPAHADQSLRSWLAERCPSEGSRLSYRADLAQFAAYLREIGRDVLELTRDDVVTWLEFLRTRELSAATRAKKLTVLKGMVRSLMLDGLFPREQAERILDIKAPSVPRDGRTPGLSRAEARKLLDSPDPHSLRGIRDRAILAVLLYTGCRRSALVNIKLGDIQGRDSRGRAKQTSAGRTAPQRAAAKHEGDNEQGVHYILLHEKGDRKVRAPLHPQASERIQHWIDSAGLRDSDPQGWLFRPFNRRGSQLQDKPLHEFMPWYIVRSHAHSVRLGPVHVGLAGGGRGVARRARARRSLNARYRHHGQLRRRGQARGDPAARRA